MSIQSIWKQQEFKAYLGATAFTGTSFAMQMLLVSWLLIGILSLPGEQVGFIQALVGLPGIALMLWGGASADRIDPRRLLVYVYLLAPIFPLGLIAADQLGALGVSSVMAFALGMSVIQSFSSPAQQAILSRVTGAAIQQGITASTAVAFLMQMLGLALAGQMERLGLTTVLSLQAVTLLLGALMIKRLSSQPPAVSSAGQSVLSGIMAGLHETARHPIILNVLLITFMSSIFNAAAFMTVFPFIVKRIYQGDAFELALMMIVFFAGATVSNLFMLRWMPLRHPGRLYLLMQLSRIVILLLLWMQPHWWILYGVVFAWGLNMGVSMTLARTIVQESATEEFRGRILSIFNLGMLGSAPIGALVLGWVIESFGVLEALLPAMLVSFVLCAYGIFLTGIWNYRSPSLYPEP